MKGFVAVAALAAALVAAAPSFASPARPGAGTPFITDTLAPGGGGGGKAAHVAQPQQGYRFITDTLAPGGGTSQPVTVETRASFAWMDAGLGAVVAVGAVLILLGGSIVVRNRTRLAV